MNIKRVEIKNPILKGFFKDKKNAELYDLYRKSPSKEIRDKLNKNFLNFYYKIRLVSYFSKVIGFEAKKFDMKVRKYKDKNQLILDKPIGDNQSSLIDLLEIPEQEITFENYEQIDDYFVEPKVYKKISKLTERQKKILFLAYIRNLNDTEIAQLLNVSQQAVTKTRNLALKKARGG